MGGQIYFYQKYHSREANFDFFFHVFFNFPIFDFIFEFFAENSTFSVKRSGGTPNSQFKIVRGTPNPDQISESADARTASAGRGA